jgi:phosphoribosylamine--glycine ligase
MVGRGTTIQAARDAAYRGVAEVALEGGRYRTDIASRELPGDGAELGHEAG